MRVAHRGGRLLERVVIGRDLGQRRAGEVVADGRRDDEVAVGEALHEGAGAEAVGAVVREVRLAQDVQPRDGAHQVVVHPQAAHRVVDGRVDPHRHLVRILVGDLLVHLEEVAVARAHGVLADAADRVGEIQVDGQLRLADAAAFVADRLGGARRDVAGHQVAEARVAPLEVVVALGFGDLLRRPLVAAASSAPRRARRCAGSRSSA